MKFFPTPQIRELDRYTIDHEPISSIDLMERAANMLHLEVLSRIDFNDTLCVLAGPGNNGGDALALARLLLGAGCKVKAILLNNGKLSADCDTNRLRLSEQFPESLTELSNNFVAPALERDTIVIDGLFGSGLARPLSGMFAEAVKWINNSGHRVYSIDIPSGLHGEENPDLTAPIVIADETFSLQFPKLAFLLPETAAFAGNWHIVDIGLHPEAIRQTSSNYHFLKTNDLAPILKKRSRFSHKGTFGHAVIVAGCKGMAGASVLAAKASLRSGAGLVTVHGPKCNRNIVQTAVPEAMFIGDKNKNIITVISDGELAQTLAIGPGIGTNPATADLLRYLLSQAKTPCILDADALNILAEKKELLKIVPAGSILTPHPKEFERLFGECKNSLERIRKASEMACTLKMTIVLKGAYSLIATPDGNMHFNSTGNPGMATGGSGDVLTGILAGLLAQGYTPEETAKLGVFIHGRAGDLALENESHESLTAGDIISHLGLAFRSLNIDKPKLRQ